MPHLPIPPSLTHLQPTLFVALTNDSWIQKLSRSNLLIMLVDPWRKSPVEWLSDGQVRLGLIAKGRRILNLRLDYAQDHADLGAALNGFSLNESGELSGAIEKTGQAIDATYMSTTKLVRNRYLCTPSIVGLI